MGKSTHFFGQPVYGQLIKSLDRDKIVQMSRTRVVNAM
ncbi:transposase [Bacteroides heparinolyticus]|uniref:Transposase n=1 Tax=Prevotella heparinolytica TaxID=28113 RepID=A0A449I6M2_9BACE|nr:transposase [Bacteroides heparinolyticus]